MGRAQVGDHDEAADAKRDDQSPAGARGTQRRKGPIAKHQKRRECNVRDHAADQNARMQTHIACPPHGITEQVKHGDADGTAKGDIGVCERIHEHLVAPAHPTKEMRTGQQHHRRKNSGKCKSQQKCVESQFVGPLALARSERARDGRRHAGAHPTVGGLQNQHDPWKRQ